MGRFKNGLPLFKNGLPCMLGCCVECEFLGPFRVVYEISNWGAKTGVASNGANYLFTPDSDMNGVYAFELPTGLPANFYGSVFFTRWVPITTAAQVAAGNLTMEAGSSSGTRPIFLSFNIVNLNGNIGCGVGGLAVIPQYFPAIVGTGGVSFSPPVVGDYMQCSGNRAKVIATGESFIEVLSDGYVVFGEQANGTMIDYGGGRLLGDLRVTIEEM